MTAPIVESALPVTLLGGAPLETEWLSESLSIAPCLVAADSGADTALGAGHVPEAVIGDMDSLSPAARARLDPATLHPITEQDSTDFSKALRSIRAPLVLAVGFTGARLDHELSVYNVLVRTPPGAAIVIGQEDIALHAPRRIALDLCVGTRVSLFPMRPLRGTSTGLNWPIDGLDMAPDGRVGTSNHAVAPRVELTFESEGMLLILPRAQLTRAVRALLPDRGAVPAR